MSHPYPLHQLFPGGDFEWAFRMRGADPVEFFTPRDASGSLLEQKHQILTKNPQHHLFTTPEATPLLEPLHAQLSQWHAISDRTESELHTMALAVEPDLLVMDQSSLKLVAGAVCFPSSWNPADWPGASIDKIHAVVPLLNPQIGEMIRRFLTELKPGKAFQRANWSFTRSAELNYHPALQREPLNESLKIEEVHLRIEHQLFTAIEGAVVMGIRIQPIPLLSLNGDRPLWEKLVQILETMPENVARYKNLHLGLEKLIFLMHQV